MPNSDFLHQLNVALGFTVLPGKEPDILKEILRLREAAGEIDTIRSPHEIESMTAESVRRVPSFGGPRACMLWITTKAQHLERSSQLRGQPIRHEVLELPQRMVNLILVEPEAREAHRILDEQIQDWDLEGS